MEMGKPEGISELETIFLLEKLLHCHSNVTHLIMKVMSMSTRLESLSWCSDMMTWPRLEVVPPSVLRAH